jgi:ketopantoate reductase
MTAPGGIAIAGAGAFGTALAIALAPRPVTLWARDAGTIAATRAVTRAVAALCDGRLTIAGAMEALLNRPLKEE